MAVSSPVKYFHASMPGAPALTNQWGSLTSLLDALLVDGFGLVSVDSISISGGVATAQVANGHIFQVDQVLKLAGAVQAPINDEFRVTARTPTSFQFAAPAGVSTVTGTLSAKVSPLGFEIAFTSTNKRAYRSKNVQSPKNMLLINDGLKTDGYDTGWAKWANVGIVSAMSDIDTITGIQAPYIDAQPDYNWRPQGGNHWGWYKWFFARTSGTEFSGDGGPGSRSWVVVGDDRMFYLLTNAQTSGGFVGRLQYCFGDIVSYRPGDQTHTVLCADDVENSSAFVNYSGDTNLHGYSRNGVYNGRLLLRSHTQVGSWVRWSSVGTITDVSGYQTNAVPFPNGADYGLLLVPVMCRQEDGNVRGELPGLLWVPHNRPYPDLTVVDNVTSMVGRKVALVNAAYSGDGGAITLGFDITGPWR